ncbi:hypothetical protein VTO42DRAFT_464 [Malbranchea cinnamomea]
MHESTHQDDVPERRHQEEDRLRPLGRSVASGRLFDTTAAEEPRRREPLRQHMRVFEPDGVGPFEFYMSMCRATSCRAHEW